MSDINNRMLPLKKDGDEKDGATKRSLYAEISNPGTYYSWVESEHPYKPALLAHHKLDYKYYSTVMEQIILVIMHLKVADNLLLDFEFFIVVHQNLGLCTCMTCDVSQDYESSHLCSYVLCSLRVFIYLDCLFILLFFMYDFIFNKVISYFGFFFTLFS